MSSIDGQNKPNRRVFWEAEELPRGTQAGSPLENSGSDPAKLFLQRLGASQKETHPRGRNGA